MIKGKGFNEMLYASANAIACSANGIMTEEDVQTLIRLPFYDGILRLLVVGCISTSDLTQQELSLLVNVSSSIITISQRLVYINRFYSSILWERMGTSAVEKGIQMQLLYLGITIMIFKINSNNFYSDLRDSLLKLVENKSCVIARETSFDEKSKMLVSKWLFVKDVEFDGTTIAEFFSLYGKNFFQRFQFQFTDISEKDYQLMLMRFFESDTDNEIDAYIRTYL